MDLIKDKALQFSWDPILNIPTSGSGRPSRHPCQILSHKLFNANLQGQENLLEKYQSISDEQVIAFSRWIHGTVFERLDSKRNPIVKLLFPHKNRNLQLLIKFKIKLRKLSNIIHMTIKNHISHSSYKALLVDKEKFLYKDGITNQNVFCGLILLKLIIGIIKPE